MQGLNSKFCDMAQDQKTKASQDFSEQDYIPSHRRGAVIPRSPPPKPVTPANGNHWRFHYEFNPAGGDCRKNCQDAFTTLTNKCGRAGPEQNLMTPTGSIDVGCGTYSYEIFNPAPDEAKCDIGETFYNGRQRTSFTVEQANDAIPKFCADKTLNISNPIQPEGFTQFETKASGAYPRRWYQYKNTMIDIFAAFADTVQLNINNGCKNPTDTNFMVHDYEEACKTLLFNAVHSCEYSPLLLLLLLLSLQFISIH
jgi:hypothetical protein